MVGSKKADEQQVKTPITNLATSNANAGLTIIASAIKKYHTKKINIRINSWICILTILRKKIC